ncbi:putative transmembrane sensor [plant metagenome]|uniref:Putative transmembrane sensor n=1 Tax=plant metagenome TaxID=1297885 RepID=A0A484NRD0_9ZZZZ
MRCVGRFCGGGAVFPFSCVYIHKMSRFPQSPGETSPASFDEAADARELEEFFRQQDPVDIAAVDWHTRQENGLSEAEQAEFQQWLAASPIHAAAFENLNEGLAAMRAIPVAEVAARTTQTSRLEAPPRMAPLSVANAGSGRSAAAKAPRAGWQQGNRASRWLPWNWSGPRQGAVAFCCVALLAVGVGWHQWTQQLTFSHHFAVERGQRQTVTLPDGSEMAIDADTRAQVTLFRDHREVRIAEGAVMFSVAPDSEKPFQVLAGPARVTVVGTRFSVRYRNTGVDAGAVKVAVEEGHVRVAGSDEVKADSQTGNETDLTAGQGVTIAIDGGVASVVAVAPNTVGLWRKGLVRFENSRLGDALVELERYGSTGLYIRDPAVAAMPLGGSFRIDRPAEFARMLPEILPVQLLRRGDGRTEIAKRP